MMKSGIAFDFIVGIRVHRHRRLGDRGLVRFIADDGKQYDLEMWKYARDVKRSKRLAGRHHWCRAHGLKVAHLMLAICSIGSELEQVLPRVAKRELQMLALRASSKGTAGSRRRQFGAR